MPTSFIEELDVCTLPADVVHVWSALLGPLTDQVPSLHAVLSAEERRRAARFKFERDSVTFTLAHGILRRLLESYCRVPAATITFTHSLAGKPALAGKLAGALHFNLSHTQGMIVFAFARERQVGIDVECLRPMPDAEALAARWFAPVEVAGLRTLPALDQLRGFFNGWTRKEAFIKAVGAGLSYPLESFAVTLAPGAPARLLDPTNGLPRGDDWTLYDVDVGPDHAAALVVEGGPGQVVARSYRSDS